VGADFFEVEVVYARALDPVCSAARVPLGTTVRGAIERVRFFERFPELDLATNRVGVYGRVCSPDTLVQAGDRVEIYCPLRVDPKRARRQRANGPSSNRDR
jgi:putative ubiquitin-RnfH superfamily antitoxin RatB of RatAB toxin-antitoxin module